MSDSDKIFNETIQSRNKKVEELNKKLKSEYERHGGLELLTKYIMSETIAPIEDYENVVKIIRENYNEQINVELLIVGAYSALLWMHSSNEMLEILNLMCPFLPDRERSIIHYLNAYKLYITDGDYASQREYYEELYASLIPNVPFVNNRLKIAELLTGTEAQKYYTEAMNNIQEIFSKDDVPEFSAKCALSTQGFIDELILGTHITKEQYKEMFGVKDIMNYSSQ